VAIATGRTRRSALLNTMNPMKKPVASVLRVVGAGLILLSVVLIAFLWLARYRNPEPWWRWALYAVPALGGIVICAVSGKLAARLTRDYED
jgi:membrane protein YdbS with pleckstrin-like domain